MIGSIRKLDELGRVTIPKEFRDYLELYKGDRLQVVLTDNKELMFKKVSEKRS